MEVIYTAQSRSLAALEILVHYSVLPEDFVLTPVRIPDSLIIEARLNEISEGRPSEEAELISLLAADLGLISHSAEWQAHPEHTAEIGGKWIEQQISAVLSVPSSIIPAERNYILNPAHPQFSEIEFLASEPFHFDPRLKQSV